MHFKASSAIHLQLNEILPSLAGAGKLMADIADLLEDEAYYLCKYCNGLYRINSIVFTKLIITT